MLYRILCPLCVPPDNKKLVRTIKDVALDIATGHFRNKQMIYQVCNSFQVQDEIHFVCQI